MTVVHVDLRKPSQSGTDLPETGVIECRPTKRRGLVGYIVLPDSFNAPLVDGKATLDLAETGNDWCWKIRERVNAGKQRYVAVPTSGPVDYDDLVDVNPTTLDPSEEPEAAWDVALAAETTNRIAAVNDLQDQIDEGGTVGPQGPPGEDGAPGTNGTNGTNGAAGAKGDKGDPGDDGANGADGATGAAGPGVATGGTTGQTLAKASNADFDTEWVDPGGGGGFDPSADPIAIGPGVTGGTTGQHRIAIGTNSTNNAEDSIVIGGESSTLDGTYGGIILGTYLTAGNSCISIGAPAEGDNSIAIGGSAGPGASVVAVGGNVGSERSVLVGRTDLGTSYMAHDSVGIGSFVYVGHNKGIAIGATAQTVVENGAVIKADELRVLPQTTDAATTLVLNSPDGTAWRLSIDNAGTITAAPA